jgi:glycosyltransferase involved in cell wall biosynthesis
MRLLHIISRFIGGGPERHLLALAGAWRGAGFETSHSIAVLDGPVSSPLLITAIRLGIAVTVRPDADELDAAIRESDVVDIAFWNHPVLLDVLRRELPAARVLVSCAVAGVAPPQVLASELGRFSDGMIFTSAVSRQTAAGRTASGAGKPVEVIPALADMSRLDGYVARPHEGVRVGYLGIVDPNKMHSRFAELTAAVRDPRVSFEVFGDGSWAPQLQRRIEELGAGGRVRFHGHVEDLREAFAEIDVFGYPLAPDTSATSEKAIQEAMWVGIPPVVLAGTGASGLVEHGRTGLVCATDADYPLAIERLAADDGLRRRLGAAAREFARRECDPVRNGVRFRAVFDAVAGLPVRVRDPLPGYGQSAARRFVLALGEMAGPFAVSLGGSAESGPAAVAEADASIAAASAVLARSEGGVIHYRNSFPEDGFLRLWSGLIAAYGGDEETAAEEFDAAERLGLSPERVENARAAVSTVREELEQPGA